MTKEKIHKICKKYNIINYTINSDMSIDVDGHVLMRGKGLKEIPLNFNRVNGDFLCNFNLLKSLKGSPKIVESTFFCGNNLLKSLEYSPEYIGHSFYCGRNQLKTLEYFPKYVGRKIECNSNGLQSLKGVENDTFHSFECVDNNIRSFKYYPKKISNRKSFFNNPIAIFYPVFKKREYIDYFNELDIIRENETVVILDRLNYFLMDIGEREIPKKLIERNYKVK